MEYTDIRPIVDFYHAKWAHTRLDFKRYLHAKVNWESRVIGIQGERGVGKTTLLLQRMKERHGSPDETFYMSLDHLWFETHSLQDVVEFLHGQGVTELYIDEVHKYPHWSVILKNLVDRYPDLRIVYTGSSMLEIDNAKVDMSRRQTTYVLKGMSFREYLQYEGILRVDAIPLDDLLKRHLAIAMDIVPQAKVLRHFGEYLDHGVYPFYKDAGQDFLLRLKEVVDLVLESDLAAVEEVTHSTVEKCKKLFMIVAQQVPLQPNVSKLAASLDTTRDTLLRVVDALDRAEILNALAAEHKSYKKLPSPKKLYLGNTNLMAAFSPKVDTGTLRETFFAHQVSAASALQLPPKGDFLVDGKHLFEVGGRGKDFSQIADLPNSYLALDGMETGQGARIPLWMFGLLY